MIEIRPVDRDDRAWMSRLLAQWWGSPLVVSRGKVHDALELPGFVARHEGERVGLATYVIDGSGCELVTLNSTMERIGAGTALIEAVTDAARRAGCRRVWLITTNDNLPALGFYERRGLTIVAVHRDAVEHSRRLKPQIPLIGLDGIPIRDEIELELAL